MKAFFESEDRLAALEKAATSWAGTPFRHNSKVRGQGANCVLAIVGVLEDAGFAVPEFELVPANWARFQIDSVMEQWLDKHGEHFQALALTSPAALRPGDLAGFKAGLCIHHLGIILSGQRFFQCLESMGAVILGQAEREFKKRLARAWRPIISL